MGVAIDIGRAMGGGMPTGVVPYAAGCGTRIIEGAGVDRLVGTRSAAGFGISSGSGSGSGSRVCCGAVAAGALCRPLFRLNTSPSVHRDDSRKVCMNNAGVSGSGSIYGFACGCSCGCPCGCGSGCGWDSDGWVRDPHSGRGCASGVRWSDPAPPRSGGRFNCGAPAVPADAAATAVSGGGGGGSRGSLAVAPAPRMPSVAPSAAGARTPPPTPPLVGRPPLHRSAAPPRPRSPSPRLCAVPAAHNQPPRCRRRAQQAGRATPLRCGGGVLSRVRRRLTSRAGPVPPGRIPANPPALPGGQRSGTAWRGG
eukprot:COSAG01_NODE_5305_length_4350_cov_1.811809_3_plen_310_part_00